MEEETARRRKLSNWLSGIASDFKQTHGVPPQYIIKIHHALYLLILFFWAASIIRLVLHMVFRLHTIEANYLFLGIVMILAAILLASKHLNLGLLLAALGFVWGIFCTLSQRLQWNLDLFHVGYQYIRDICKDYAKPSVLVQIFLSMGFINFSLSYVASVRDKPFYGVSLGNVLQEQFPEHGQIFVFYTCLILIGLYSCGMDYHVVAFACLCGAILSLIYTGFIAMWFTFSQLSKQTMVEYYLIFSPVSPPREGQKIEEYASFNRLLAASDYINAYYKANASIPQAVSANLWRRLFDCLPYLPALPSPSKAKEEPIQRETADRAAADHSEDARVLHPGCKLENIVIYTQLVICAAAAWRRILQKMPPEQQSELICYVLQTSLHSKSDFLRSCEAFLSADDDHLRENMRVPLSDALPLCGLISYLRGKNSLSVDDPEQYWNGFEKCLQSIYQIQLIYSRTAVQMGCTYAPDTIPQMLFLLLEATLLIEASSLEKYYHAPSPDSRGFWTRLRRRERGFQLSARDCSWFSDWGLGIVCSYKVDWFRSHEGMLSAYLIYQQLFHMLQQNDGGAYDTDDKDHESGAPSVRKG